MKVICMVFVLGFVAGLEGCRIVCMREFTAVRWHVGSYCGSALLTRVCGAEKTDKASVLKKENTIIGKHILRNVLSKNTRSLYNLERYRTHT